MTHNLYISILGLLAILTIFAGEVYAETFEFLTYTPPSSWTNQVSQDKSVYQHKNGIGAITIYASNPTTRTASEEFAQMWRLRIEPTLPGKPPQPQIQREGDYSVAIGTQQVNAKDAMMTVVLASFVGKGKSICVLSMSAGDDVLREVTAFFESLKITPETSAIQSNSGGEIEVDYQVPSGLTAKNDGRMILLSPPKLNEKTPCAYWISPPRPSKGSLEADARKAALEIPIAGGQILNSERYNAMRGTAPDGWKYFLFGTSIQNSAGTSIAYAMALAFPAGAGQVNIVLGVGDGSSNCYMFDPNFVRLFHSLSPRGWTSDWGKAFSKELTGLWRSTGGGASINSNNFFLTQYNFMTNGRYASGRGSITTTGNLETTTATASDGSYKLNGNGLTLTSDVSRNVSKFRVRLYDDYFAGKWWRKMSLFNEELKIEVEYERIKDSR